jgi:hypothetical protein
MNKLEECINILNFTAFHKGIPYHHVSSENLKWLIERAKLADHLGKKAGELNEFLQQREPLPEDWGANVTDVVMRYVERLERKNYSFKKEISLIRDYCAQREDRANTAKFNNLLHPVDQTYFNGHERAFRECKKMLDESLKTEY